MTEPSGAEIRNDGRGLQRFLDQERTQGENSGQSSYLLSMSGKKRLFNVAAA